MGALPAPAPFRIFTLLKWHLTCCPSTSLSKHLQNHPQVLGPFLCPRVTKATLPSFPLILLLTQVDQLHLSIWSICRESVTLGAPWGRTQGAVGSLYFTFCCTMGLATKQGPTVSVFVIVPHDLIGQGVGFLKTAHLLFSMCICYSSSSSCLCSFCTGAASHRALSIFVFRSVRKTHPMVPMAVCAVLFGKWKLIACNALSMLPSELSTTFPIFHWSPSWENRSHTHSTTCYMVATGFLHAMESPALLPAGYPAAFSSVEPQAPLPPRYPVDHTSSITDPDCDANCLAISHCAHCPLNPG